MIDEFSDRRSSAAAWGSTPRMEDLDLHLEPTDTFHAIAGTLDSQGKGAAVHELRRVEGIALGPHGAARYVIDRDGRVDLRSVALG